MSISVCEVWSQLLRVMKNPLVQEGGMVLQYRSFDQRIMRKVVITALATRNGSRASGLTPLQLETRFGGENTWELCREGSWGSKGNRGCIRSAVQEDGRHARIMMV